METADKKYTRPETVLFIIALVAGILLTVMVMLCLPEIAADMGFGEEPVAPVTEPTHGAGNHRGDGTDSAAAGGQSLRRQRLPV